jgi:hypothetical protein
MASAGETDAAAAAQHVLSLSAGFMVSAALHSVVSLDIASKLVSGPRSADELAAAVGADADALERVMRLLAAHGVFAAGPGRRYELNACARCLLPGQPGSTHAAVHWLADEFHFKVFGEGFMSSLRTGEPAVASVLGKPIFEHLAANAALSRSFNAAMSEFSEAVATGVLASYDFSGIDVLADIGGGLGAVLAAILRAHPAMRGVLFELPQVAAGAGAALARAAVADRATVVAGDFFAPDAPLPHADAYVMKHIIHDWDDARATAILCAVRGAMQPPLASKRVLLLERVVPPADAHADVEDEAARFTRVIDMEMLVVAGGRERSEAQFADLLRGAGLRLCRVVPTRTQLSVIEARPETD